MMVVKLSLILVQILWTMSLASVHIDEAYEACDKLSSISAEIWANDVNRFTESDVTVNHQTQVPDGTTVDHSNEKLFTHINETKLSTGTYKLLADLLDNYDPTKGNIETVTAGESQEVNTFLDAILNTTVMNSLLKYLICKDIVKDHTDLKSRLYKLWFDFYPRSGKKTTNDTSGFEHVFVGEYKNNKCIGGLHNWVSFYFKEKNGSLNYFGFVNKSEPNYVGAAFSWNNHVKTLGSFFIGVSPELDVALYTLCFLTHRNKACPVTLNGSVVTVMTKGRGHIDTAFVIVNKNKDEKQKNKREKQKKKEEKQKKEEEKQKKEGEKQSKKSRKQKKKFDKPEMKKPTNNQKYLERILANLNISKNLANVTK